MTRQDFIDNINYWSELLDFCSDEDCDVCEDIYSEDARDDCIDEELVDMARNNNWRDMYNILDSIPDGYDYYRQDNYGGWVGVDDEFDDYKDQVLEWMDDGGYWDDDDEEDEDDTDFFAEELARERETAEQFSDDEQVEDEDFTVGDLINMCSVTFVAIQKDNARREMEESEAFNQYVNTNIPKPIERS